MGILSRPKIGVVRRGRHIKSGDGIIHGHARRQPDEKDVMTLAFVCNKAVSIMIASRTSDYSPYLRECMN